MATATTEKRKIKLTNVRLSYPALFEARKSNFKDSGNSEAKYSAEYILTTKEHKQTLKEIEAEIARVATEKWGKVPKVMKSFLTDGSTILDKETDEPKEEYGPGTWRIRASNKSRPQVVNRDLSPADEETVYAGCYVNAVITVWAYDHPTGGKGVGANLGPVQYNRKGDPFGGSQIAADEVFEASDDSDDDDAGLDD